MSLSGPQALKSLDDALREIRREEDEIAKRLARGGEIVTKMREHEGELLRQLAQVRLDPSVQAELDGQISGAERKARDMLKTHGAALEGAAAAIAALDADIEKQAAARTRLQSDAAGHDDQLAAIASTVRPKLMGDTGYAKQRGETDALKQVADQSLKKTEQAEADRDEKGRPYRSDPLFMYLWERGYGTKGYRAGGLIAFLDGKVAALVGFVEARPNFAMLNEIPTRLRTHAEHQRAAAETAADALLLLETAAIDAAGGKAPREALQRAAASVSEADARIVVLEDQRDDALKAQRDLAQGTDPAFAEALSALAQALGREDLNVLLADARATRSGADDTIVRQIDDARQRVKDEDEELAEQKARLKTLGGRRRELEDIQYEFKKQGFDNPHSRFREDDLAGDLLNEFLRGGMSAANYWTRWQRSQSWTRGAEEWNFDKRFGGIEAPRTGNWGHVAWPDTSIAGGSGRRPGGPGGGWGGIDFGGGSSGGSSGSDNFSRPRSGSSGTRTHGGFKTGGGF